MFKWQYQAEESTTATKEAIWHLWSDVAGWPVWDHELIFCSLEGDFHTGKQGKLQTKGGPVLSFTLTRVEPMRAFSDATKLPGATLTFHHELDGKTLRHSVEIRGILTPVLKRTLGRKLKKGLPKALKSLVGHAEKLSL